ncbi:MAG: hypothetical protein RR821_10040 [Clostridia bacterium]
MTRQEIEKLLGEGASKEQVDALLNAMHAEIKSHNICFYVPPPLFSFFVTYVSTLPTPQNDTI